MYVDLWSLFMILGGKSSFQHIQQPLQLLAPPSSSLSHASELIPTLIYTLYILTSLNKKLPNMHIQ